jgi:hypothetical protein
MKVVACILCSVYLAGALAVHLSDFTVNDEASHVKVMHSHVIVQAA